MKVKGFSHVTINVSNLDESLDFYHNVLGMSIRHKGNKDAYLEWGSAWVCLIERSNYSGIKEDSIGTDHIAFYILEEDFQDAVDKLNNNQITIVRGPLSRGTGQSINFLDPDGIELELHTSTLDDRMKVWK
jgi:catechol 2,3-dioxygenase-like lactoylglutathione lyase family enzyme